LILIFFSNNEKREYIFFNIEKNVTHTIGVLLGGESSRDYYDLALAIKNNDINYCGTENCTEEYINYVGDHNLCSLTKNLETCYLTLGVTRSDPSYCEFISNENKKNSCKQKVAKVKKYKYSPYLKSVCNNSSSYLDKYKCIANKAAINKKTKDCDSILRLSRTIWGSCYVYSEYNKKEISLTSYVFTLLIF
jgi:hypothetical protein